MTINSCKSNVVHVRPTSFERLSRVFKCGDMNIATSSEYAYLGLVLNEFLDFSIAEKAVARSANRALGLVIAKCKAIGGISYDVYKKLFDSLVSPIAEYGVAIWGCKDFSFINAIQMSACRFFLGVGKYTPNPAIMGDMEGIPIYHTQWKVIARHWHRLVNMEPDRINRKIFIWADEVSLKHRIIK